MRKIVLLLSTLLIACSCEWEEKGRIGPDMSTFKEMIDCYIIADEFELTFSYDYSFLRISPAQKRILYGDEEKALTLKYDDTHYNKKRLPGTYWAYATEFTSITVTSDTEFNGIPPGENIGGKIRLVAVSPYRWLKSTSTLYYDWSVIPQDYKTITESLGVFSLFEFCPENHPVNKLLTSLTPEDLLLINPQCLYLLFTEDPQIKTHNLTINIFAGDNVISTTQEVTFSNV